jgi:hypothetical protein
LRAYFEVEGRFAEEGDDTGEGGQGGGAQDEAGMEILVEGPGLGVVDVFWRGGRDDFGRRDEGGKLGELILGGGSRGGGGRGCCHGAGTMLVTRKLY